MSPAARERAYLDFNATAPLREAALGAMTRALVHLGNPSSVHAEGREARRLVEEARGKVAALVGAKPANVVFTSGGTEANVLALSPGTRPLGSSVEMRRLLVSAVEHPSVLAGGRFPPDRVERVAVDEQGRLDLADFERKLKGGDGPALVSVMAANNETGVLQPIREAAEIAHAGGHLLHVDAVQAAGRVAIGLGAADLLTLSAHKIGGPQGIGVLVFDDARIHIEPLLKGGGQERGRRAGTEAVALMAGFGAAAEAAGAESADSSRMSRLRAWLEADLRTISPEAEIFGAGAERLPNTTCFGLRGVKAETAVIALDLAGVAVSSGSACSSGKVSESHVLRAMGVAPELMRSAIRVSLGWSSRDSDVGRFLEAWRSFSAKLATERRHSGVPVPA
jgi:cysteine desulfurase